MAHISSQHDQPPQKDRRLVAVLAIALFALLPPLALALSAAAPVATAPQRLIVWLPQAQPGNLATAAATLDAADARPLAEGSLTGLWLVATRRPDARDRLYAAGAHLVLPGDGLLAGCFGFSPAS